MPRTTAKTKEAQRLEELAKETKPEATEPQQPTPEAFHRTEGNHPHHQSLGMFAAGLGDALTDNVASMATTEIHRQLQDGRLIRKIENRLMESFSGYLAGLDGNAKTIHVEIEGEKANFFLPSQSSQTPSN